MPELLCAVVFGLTSPLVGHPLDTLKTKMIAQPGFASGSSVAALATVLRTEGVGGLYKGLLPPLLGSAAFRSLQFAAYGVGMSALAEQHWATAPLPLSSGLQPRVLLAATLATTLRAAIEAPLEYAKVRRQTGLRVLQAESVAQVMRGGPRGVLRELQLFYLNGSFALTWARLWIALGGFFVLVDHCDRHYPALGSLSLPVVGPFFKGAVCATFAWWLAWPLEVVKNQAQAGTVPADCRSLRQRLSWVLAHRGGVVGLFRGVGPGTARSIVANGSATAAFSHCQDCMRGPPPVLA